MGPKQASIIQEPVLGDATGNDSTAATISVSQGLAYACPTLVTTFLVIPAGIILPGIYAKYFGLALTTVATILLAARLFDAVTDPLIGYFSDRYRARSGTRKPWVLIGGLGTLVSGYFLFVPPADVSAQYFLIWFLIFYLAWTLFEIPHISWGGELTNVSQEKTKVYSLRAACVFLGSLVFYGIPLLPFFETTEISPASLKWSVFLAIIVMLPLLFLCLKTVPDGQQPVLQNKDAGAPLLRSLMSNKPLLLFLSAYFIGGVGMGMWMGLIFIYIDSYLGMGVKAPFIFLSGTVFGFLSLRVWQLLAHQYGKKAAMATGMLVVVIGVVLTGLPIPTDRLLFFLVVDMCLISLGTASMYVLAPSILSDIVDYGTWKFGTNRSATYFSLYTLITKANIGIGASVAIGIAGWYGFDPTEVTPSAQSVFGLRLAISYLPAFIILLCTAIILVFPIHARRHQVIIKSLARRACRVAHSNDIEESKAPY